MYQPSSIGGTDSHDDDDTPSVTQTQRPEIPPIAKARPEERQTGQREKPFPFSDDYEKLETLRQHFRSIKKSSEIHGLTFEKYLPEPISDRANYLGPDEIMKRYEFEIEKIMQKLKEVFWQKQEALERYESFKRLYEASKEKLPFHRLKVVTKSKLKLNRPVFLCPLPYCAGHCMNLNKHRIVAHPEIRTAEDIELYDILVYNMKSATLKKVATLGLDQMTPNRALLQKMNLNFSKIVTPNKKSSVFKRKHYLCPICDKIYPSIDQHITRKHKTMKEIEKGNLREKMKANVAQKTTTKALTNPDYFTANINTTLSKMCKHIPREVSTVITDFVSQIAYVITQREVNFIQTVGLIKRIVIYCIKFATTSLQKHGSFDWQNTLTSGIKDLLNENNLDKLSVNGSAFSSRMKKKTLNVIVKLLNFHQESFNISTSTFPLLTEEKVRMLRALIEARSSRLNREIKENQRQNIVRGIYEGNNKHPTTEQLFYACDRAPIKKILRHIVRVGTAVEEGKIVNVVKCPTLAQRKMHSQEHQVEDPTQDATIETNRTAQVSMKQYRRALILYIYCKNAPRSMEILKYSVEDYKRDRLKYLQSDDKEGMVLHLQQHTTAKNRNGAIAWVQGLAKDALYHYVYNIRPFMAPPKLKNVFFSTHGRKISYAGLNKDLTKIFQYAYPDTNYVITTRAFLKVGTSFCEKDALEQATPLCPDTKTAQHLCDLSPGILAAKREHAKISKTILNAREEPRESQVTAQPDTTTPATTTPPPSPPERQLVSPSASGASTLQTFLEDLQTLKMTPREKFNKIFVKNGPVQLPFETFVHCLTPSQRKTGRKRLNEYFMSALEAYNSTLKRDQDKD